MLSFWDYFFLGVVIHNVNVSDKKKVSFLSFYLFVGHLNTLDGGAKIRSVQYVLKNPGKISPHCPFGHGGLQIFVILLV